FGDQGLVLLAVNFQERREPVAAFMREHGLTFRVALDPDAEVSDRYGVRFIPTTVILDREGRMLARVVGPREWDSSPARQLFAGLLGRTVAAAPARPAEPAGPEAAVAAFLERHWQRPIPLQGKPPAGWNPLEASLDPASCGACHPAQLEEWKTSLHAKAMGPGVMGQLVDMYRTDPATAIHCQSCHAPLTEQLPRVERTAAGRTAFRANRAFDRALKAQGLVCAACHVREWQRFGPPKRDGSLEGAAPREQLPHHGATRTPAFLRSEFCKECHQFPPDGYALNGKLLENTYEEWRASPYAREGVQCQDCHMPDRRHLWRGIHDPEMVKRAVTIDLKTSKPRYCPGETIRAVLTVTNTGAGHSFPTYLTPKVFVRMELVDAQGQPVPESLEEAVIGREATLDLSRELYDTRLAPKASFAMRYSRKIDRPGLRLRARVVVEPDHFYTRFFEAVIPQAQRGKRQLEEALAETRRSHFTIFSRDLPLG
ncbi:MAG: redoxin family protein, partial [Candidatus Rokubacteria bacterium]|nr:redoxin family protein [Candidatus Rokubacteria bacterium]